MVNTINNTPEKTNKSGNNLLKKTVALAIALTLSGEPSEAKTYEKQEFPTEIVANLSGEISPMTENIEQTSVTNYINKAKIGVKRYFPEYENYFNNIFLEIKRLGGYEEFLINKEIEKNLVLSGDLLVNEKEIITTILVSLENITGKENFKNRKGISEDDDIGEIAKDIKDGFFKYYLKQREYIENFQKDIKNLNEKIGTTTLDEIGNEYISISEKYMELLKDFLLNYGFLKTSKEIQEWIETYKTILKKTNKKPSQIGQKYVYEYNKIRNQGS